MNKKQQALPEKYNTEIVKILDIISANVSKKVIEQFDVFNKTNIEKINKNNDLLSILSSMANKLESTLSGVQNNIKEVQKSIEVDKKQFLGMNKSLSELSRQQKSSNEQQNQNQTDMSGIVKSVDNLSSEFAKLSGPESEIGKELRQSNEKHENLSRETHDILTKIIELQEQEKSDLSVIVESISTTKSDLNDLSDAESEFRNKLEIKNGEYEQSFKDLQISLSTINDQQNQHISDINNVSGSINTISSTLEDLRNSGLEAKKELATLKSSNKALKDGDHDRYEQILHQLGQVETLFQEQNINIIEKYVWLGKKYLWVNTIFGVLLMTGLIVNIFK